MRKDRKRKARRLVLPGACLAAGVLLLAAALTVRAEKEAPEGCSLKRVRLAQTACFPLGADGWRVSDLYGWRTDPFTGAKRFHQGVDLACPEGTPVVAVLDGIVNAARYSGSYGNYLRLCHGSGQETLYAHLQYLFVRVGEVVQAGQLLGTAGSTGRATGSHLHFEFLEKDVRCDPGALLELP